MIPSSATPELPQIPVEDMRQILKNNTKNYLQQDLPGHTFDCYFIPTRPRSGRTKRPNSMPVPQKLKVLVGGAKKQLTDDLQAAVKQAGLIPDQVVPGFVGPVNAFELAMPDAFTRKPWRWWTSVSRAPPSACFTRAN